MSPEVVYRKHLIFKAFLSPAEAFSWIKSNPLISDQSYFLTVSQPVPKLKSIQTPLLRDMPILDLATGTS